MLYGNVGALVSGDSITLSLAVGGVSLSVGSVGGSPVSNATHSAEHTVLLSNRDGGQAVDELDGGVTQNNQPVFGLKLTNNGQATVTVSQLVFQLSAVNAIASGDINGATLRLNDGTSDLATGGTVSITGTGGTGTGTITMPTSFTITAGAFKNLTLYADFANLANGDTLTIGLGNGQRHAGGRLGRRHRATPVTHTAEHTVLMAEHASGQVTDAFFTQDSVTGASFFRFRLTNNTTGTVTVTQVQFQLSQVNGIADAELQSLVLDSGSGNVGGAGSGHLWQRRDRHGDDHVLDFVHHHSRANGQLHAERRRHQPGRRSTR